ncbi:Hypothetical predicted protein, partial [Paramuricea clavata]
LFKQDLLPLCSQSRRGENDVWAITAAWETKDSVHHKATASPLPVGNVWSEMEGIFPPQNYKMSCIDSDDATLLIEVYRLISPNANVHVSSISSLIHKFGSTTIGATSYGSKLVPRSIRSSRILASWPDNHGGVNKEIFSLTPRVVQFYFKHTIEMDGKNVMHIFAYVKWHKPANDINEIGNPAQ